MNVALFGSGGLAFGNKSVTMLVGMSTIVLGKVKLSRCRSKLEIKFFDNW